MIDGAMRVLDQKLIITKTVNELLFEGYDDKMLDIARRFNVTQIPFSKFGWFFSVSIFYKINKTEKKFNKIY